MTNITPNPLEILVGEDLTADPATLRTPNKTALTPNWQLAVLLPVLGRFLLGLPRDCGGPWLSGFVA